jgi:translocation and assembly module TamB
LTEAASPPRNPTAKGAKRQEAETRLKKRRFRLIWLPFWAGGGLVALLLAVLLVARFAILTDTGRNTLVGYLDGLELSRFGTLQLSGLSGDVLGDFKVERLAVVDEQGVWLEGRDVAMRWNSYSLLRRRLWAESVTAREMRVFRRPVLKEKEDKPRRDLPVSIRIDDARFRLITEPAFSKRPGDYSVRARTRVARDGPIWAQVDALSLLHAGDGLAATVSLRGEQFLVTADAIEEAGGALAGAVGLPTDQAFVLRLRADGRREEANLQLQTRSGGRAPLVADGRWDRSGGHLRAGLDLTVSSLTRPYVARLGDRLGVAADIDPDQGPFYALNAAISAANLRATAIGRIDVDARRAPQGLRITAGTGNLPQLIGTDVARTAEIDGVLTGGIEDFRFEGRSAVNGIASPNFSSPMCPDHSAGAAERGVRRRGGAARPRRAGGRTAGRLAGRQPARGVRGDAAEGRSDPGSLDGSGRLRVSRPWIGKPQRAGRPDLRGRRQRIQPRRGPPGRPGRSECEVPGASGRRDSPLELQRRRTRSAASHGHG